MTQEAIQAPAMPYPVLFSPAAIGQLVVPNRLVFAATSSELADRNGYVTDDMIAYYAERARGGVGLVVVEATYIEQEGKRLHHNAMIDDDRYVPGMAHLARAVHEAGSRVALQLNHGGRESVPEVSGVVLAPSPMPSQFTGVGNSVVPKELTVLEIHRIVSRFAIAATRCREAGFDAVELHGAHGYLIGQFLSPEANRREDDYGGDTIRRGRFFVEIVEAIKRAVGTDFPIVCRINGRDDVPNGLQLAGAVETGKLLVKAGADSISVSGGVHASRPYGVAPGMSVRRGIYVPYADAFMTQLDVPIMCVGRIKTPRMAEEILEQGAADFVCMSRALLADPQFLVNAKSGQEHLTVPCIACNECLANVHRHRGIVCTMNPAASHEREFHELRGRPVDAKRIVVIGGGIAGMAAAVTAAGRGHEVTIVEASDALGGQLLLAYLPPHREELEEALKFYIQETYRSGVQVHLGRSPTAHDIAAMKPDHVIIAIGAGARAAGIPGEDLPHVRPGWKVLSGEAATGDVCVVIGGGLVGVEVADHLAEEGKAVVLIARSGVLAKAVHADEVYFTDRIRELGVEVLTHTRVAEIGVDFVRIQPAVSLARTLTGVDNVVLCAGYSPRSEIAAALQPEGIAVTWIGDVLGSRKLFEAVEEGTRIAMAL